MGNKMKKEEGKMIVTNDIKEGGLYEEYSEVYAHSDHTFWTCCKPQDYD